LGWFVRGVIIDHDGNAACAVQEWLQSTQFDPYKAFKQFKPFKAFKQFAPFQPALSGSFGNTPCAIVLAAGANG